MKFRDVHLTFKTDEGTSEMLKFIAHGMKKTQPELINEICQDFLKDFIKTMNDEAETRLREEGYTTEQIYQTE